MNLVTIMKCHLSVSPFTGCLRLQVAAQLFFLYPSPHRLALVRTVFFPVGGDVWQSELNLFHEYVTFIFLLLAG